MMMVCVAVCGVDSGGRLHAMAPEVRIETDLVYGADDSGYQKLDLYLPVDAGGRRPVVIFVHGGGWKGGSKASGKKHAAWLAEHGFVVASMDYRLTDVAGWPAQINDGYAAVRWIRDHADQYNLDRDRIGVWGTSAGAHLAILMGNRPDPQDHPTSSRVQAVCDWFGPSDLSTMPPNIVDETRSAAQVANSNGAKLLRATVSSVPELAQDASGLHHVTSDDPAILIMHGDQDTGVPIQQSQRLHQAARASGVKSQLHVVQGAGHGGKQFQTPEVRTEVLSFFQSTLMRSTETPSAVASSTNSSGWPQGSGPAADFSAAGPRPPDDWSVVRSRNIVWNKTLPETGQSTVTVWGDRIFFTTMEEVTADAELGQNIIAWCCDAGTGATIWNRKVTGQFPLRLSGCFSDSSAPPAVTDGQRVCFFNASGRISCFDFDGNELWTREVMPVGRTQPMIIDDGVAFIRQRYMPDDQGHFTHEHKDAPVEQWTQIECLDMRTGKTKWTTDCGVNMGCVPVLAERTDGRRVIVVGRGGGHSPPEHPEGISMLDAQDGSTLWTLPLPGFMSTMAFHLSQGNVLVFHDDQHLWIDENNGKVNRSVSFLNDVAVCRHSAEGWQIVNESLPAAKNKRAIIQQSNILAGQFHYFRSYSRPYLGRIHVQTGRVDYLQLPVQVKRSLTGDEQWLWDESGMSANVIAEVRKESKKRSSVIPIERWHFEPNDMKNSRGLVVMGDNRSMGTGWGHHASPIPTVVNQRLYVPIMNGTVYVIDSQAPRLDETALIAVNDLGQVGQSFQRAAISYADGKLYAHTIRQITCIGNQ
ncbi:alpha/beta hydrolase fold domain-containing protein [Rubripirellula lacrimiformis]|nr:alpha/beta hydrolase fold domain-containing protein [Rubripirellula lacrimiformis]